jgi:phosphoglycolate phosphatase
MKIIFDLDGTLICSKKRLYRLFIDLTEAVNFEFKSYWNLKHQGKRNEDILRDQLGFSELEIENFLKNWMIKIETDY